jgi:acyl-[acyl-carrier-protein]-phospholipid O-acyltransferase/long-chain-fatty-acid--[acyl-carrier-protein] ligase
MTSTDTAAEPTAIRIDEPASGESPTFVNPDSTRRHLFQALVESKRAFGGKTVILEDAQRQPLTYSRLVIGALALGRKLTRGTRTGERIGVFLPSVQATAVTFFGLHAFARVPAMLNFTAGAANLKAACEIAAIGTIVTSRKFVDEGKLDEPLEAIAQGRRVIYLEDVREEVTSLDKARAAAESLFAGAIARAGGLTPDDEGVILFTSGSEGKPKAVVLTHANLLANAAQVMQHAEGVLGRDDIFFNPLPVFHSFGLTAGLILPLIHGIRSFLYPSPLHYKQVPKLIESAKATFLLATDTFLQGYARAAGDVDMSSVRYIVAGAERVREETQRLWSRYDAMILEGYGATECAPVIACNLPQRNRHGSVGPFLPGMRWKLTPVEGIKRGGRLSIAGPNVMAGYIDPDDPTRLIPPEGGWHDTGDIVMIEDGFVTIRGRAKRFAKIAGEMISLAAVETMIQELWPDDTHVVVALADERKGEQLVLVTEKPDADREAVVEYGREKGFSDLWLPKAVLVAQIPVLGSGKIDYAGTEALAAKLRAMM